jgi:hypothetical protein
VIARAGNRCESCGSPPKPGQSLDAVHLGKSTLAVIRGEGDPFDMSEIAAGDRNCHRAYSAGMGRRPPSLFLTTSPSFAAK